MIVGELVVRVHEAVLVMSAVRVATAIIRASEFIHRLLHGRDVVWLVMMLRQARVVVQIRMLMGT